MPSGSTYISDSVLSLPFAKALILKLNKFLNAQGVSRIQSLHRRTDNSALTTPANRDKQNIKQAWLNLSFRLYFLVREAEHNYYFAETYRDTGLKVIFNTSRTLVLSFYCCFRTYDWQH